MPPLKRSCVVMLLIVVAACSSPTPPSYPVHARPVASARIRPILKITVTVTRESALSPPAELPSSEQQDGEQWRTPTLTA
jgi:hypothetical protein